MPYGIKSESHPKTHDAEKNVAVVDAAVKNVFGSVMPVLWAPAQAGTLP